MKLPWYQQRLEDTRRLSLLYSRVSRTAIGRNLLTRFFDLRDSGSVVIMDYPESLRARFRAIQSSHEPLSAFFLTDGDKGTIYLDFKAELGVLAIYFVHELTHCLDQNLWDMALGKYTPATSQKIRLESERCAFQNQYRFQSELKTIEPKLEMHLFDTYPEITVLHEELDLGTLKKMYS